MSTINKLGRPLAANLVGSTPYGNLAAFRYILETNASGAVVNGDSTAAVASGDTVKIGVLPAGFRLIDSEVIVITGMTATITADVGFAYVDGVDSTEVPQDADYFGDNIDVATAARLRNARPLATVTLPKDAYLTLTTAVAANAKASKLEIIVFGVVEGVV